MHQISLGGSPKWATSFWTHWESWNQTSEHRILFKTYMIYTSTEVPLGDNARALRGNLRWLQAELKVRICGKPFRQLRDYPANKNYPANETSASRRIGVRKSIA